MSKSIELIKQDIQNLISSTTAHIVEEDFEFEGHHVKAYLVLPLSLIDKSEEVAKAVFTEDVLDDNLDEPEAEEKKNAPKKAPVKKATKKTKK